MKEEINLWLSGISKVGIFLVIFTTLFLFWNSTTEFYDSPKFLVLLIITGILLISLTVRFVLSGKVVLIRTPLDIPLLLLVAAAIVSTIFSQSPYVALLGNQLRIHGSLVSLILYILLYFVLVNNLKTSSSIRGLFYVIILASSVLSIISLLSYAGVKLLPSPWIHGINFTTTGSSFSTTALLALLIPFVVSQILSTGFNKFNQKENLIIKGAASFILTLFCLAIALTGSLSTWIAASAGFVFSLMINGFFKKITTTSIRNINFQIVLISLAVPVVIVSLVGLLSFIPPLGGAINPLYSQAKNFPREQQLPFVPSWKIAVSAFRDSPFWGSGPATFLFNFTNYKPIEVNSSKIWNLRFDNAFNEYLQTLATLGGIGLLALVSLTVLFVSLSIKTLTHLYSLDNTTDLSSQTLKINLAISGLLFFLLMALHPSTLTLWVFGTLILASFMATKEPSSRPSSDHSTGNDIKDVLLKIAGNTSFNPSSQTFKVEALPSIILVISISIVLSSFYFAGKFFLADTHHRKALNAVSQNQGLIAYNELVIAEKLNPYSDVYRTDLAQTNFALANAIAAAKGPTESSPSGSLTDQDKQNIQILIQQSINEGRAAASLSPRSALNWEILALLYRQIAGVAQNALVFSLDAYGKAIFQDPLNPNLRLAVGGVYYAVQSYDLAIRFFADAINLKPDLANGYFNLSVALRDKGDLNNAQAAAEKVLTLVESNSQDYKTVSGYLNDLKNRIASGSAQESQIQPPAAQTTGALQKKELPKVVDVGTPPEKIATPPAVKKPETSPSPSP